MIPQTDKWATNPNLAILIRMKEIARGNMDILQQMLLLAETDSVIYHESPGVNLFLSDSYIGLPKELSLDFRQRIEQEKQDEIIEGGLQVKLNSDYLEANNARRAVYHLNQGIIKSANNLEIYEPLIKLTLGRIVMDERIPKGIEFMGCMGPTTEAFRAAYR